MNNTFGLEAKKDSDILLTYSENLSTSDIDEIISAKNKETIELKNNIARIEKFIHVLDSISKYCLYIKDIYDKSFFDYLDVRTKINDKLSKGTDCDKDIKSEYINFLNDEGIGYNDSYDFVIKEYTSAKKSNDKIIKLRKQYEAIGILVDGEYTILDGVIYDVLSKKMSYYIKNHKNVSYLITQISDEIKRRLQEFKQVNSFYSKLVNSFNANISQYKGLYYRGLFRTYMLQSILGLDTEERYIPPDARNDIMPVSEAVNSEEFMQYLDSLDDLYPAEGEIFPTIEAAQKHIDSVITDVFTMENGENPLKIEMVKFLTYNPEDVPDVEEMIRNKKNNKYEDEQAPILYTSDYAEIKLSLVDGKRLTDTLDIEEYSASDSSHTIYVPFNAHSNFNENCVKSIAVWLDSYYLYKTISDLDALFGEFKEKEWMDYDVYFKLDFNLNSYPLQGREKQPDLNEKLKSAIQKSDRSRKGVLEAVKSTVLTTLDENGYVFKNVFSPFIKKSEVSDIITQIDNDVRVSLSVSEVVLARRNYELLRSLVDIKSIVNSILPDIPNLTKEEVKIIKDVCDSNELFDEVFDHSFVEVGLSVLRENPITKLLGINNNVDPKKLLEHICPDGDFTKLINKNEIPINKAAESDVKSLIEQCCPKLKAGDFYCAITITDAKGEKSAVLNKILSANMENRLSDLAETIEMDIYEFEPSITKLYAHINVQPATEVEQESESISGIKINNNVYNLRIIGFPFLYGTPKPATDSDATGSPHKTTKGDKFIALNDEFDAEEFIKFVIMTKRK